MAPKKRTAPAGDRGGSETNGHSSHHITARESETQAIPVYFGIHRVGEEIVRPDDRFEAVDFSGNSLGLYNSAEAARRAIIARVQGGVQ
jgi:hypothetical protein